VGVLFVFGILARLGRRAVERVVRSSRIAASELLKRLLINTISKLIWFMGFLVVLSMFGIDIGPMLAGLGIAGFVLGFALQDTLSNFAAGLMIMVYRPFDVEDIVTAGGVTGVVQAVTLVSTVITTFDNQLMIVPNSKVWGDVINNVTAEESRRVDLVFGIGYADDIDKAQRIMDDVVRSHDRVLEDPEPTIQVHNLGDSSVDFVCRPWCRTEDYWTVYWDVTRAVKERFDAEGISIPFPQRDVHVYQHGEADSASP
jgi:small conductance mechanosensitive channel